MKIRKTPIAKQKKIEKVFRMDLYGLDYYSYSFKMSLFYGFCGGVLVFKNVV